MAAVLTAEKLGVRYGGVTALVDVDLEVQEGQLVGLIGPNGAGKTTFIDAVTGFVKNTGTVSIDGVDRSGLAPHERARYGLGRTWQAADLFDDLTVRENLQVAAAKPSVRRTTREILTGRVDRAEGVQAALELLELNDLADALPDELGQGQRKLVGVARALASGPRVLLLDEPAAGLDTDESDALGRRLRKLVNGGLAMLLIDHDMGLVLNVCDHVVVLDFGQVIAQGRPADVRVDPRVIEAYLGETGLEELGLERSGDA